MLLFFVFLLLICFPFSISALGNISIDKTDTLMPQQDNIKVVIGKITDSMGDPLPGVTIIVKGTSNGTITDIDGNYSLRNISQNSILVFSFVGMDTQEIVVGNQTIINIKMEEESIGLEEVIAIGYGTMRKSDITGAISSIKSNDLKKTTSHSIDQMLQGHLSGVSITQSSGAPGRGSEVRIRGVGTLNNSSPLYVVDGVPLGTGNINYLSPNDIESIEVLKDASSAAIYGSKAANGVILVTTKKGTKGEAKIVIDSYVGIEKISNKLTMLNAKEYVDYMEESYINDGSSLAVGKPAYLVVKDEIEKGLLSPNGTDWVDVISNDKAYVQNYYIGVSGGNDFSTYSFSSSYYSQDGVLKNSSYKRFIGKLATTYKIRKNILTGFNIDYSTSKTVSITESNAVGSVYSSALIYDPTVPVYNEEGLPSATRHQSTGIQSPLGKFVLTKDDWTKTNRVNFNPYLKWDIFKELSYNTNFAYVLNNPRNFNIDPQFYYNQNSLNEKSIIGETYQNNWMLYWDNTLNYNIVLDMHRFDIMLGTSASKSFNERILGQRSGLPGDGSDPSLWSLDNAKDIERLEANPNGFSPNYSTSASYFGRLNYNYQDKYLLQLSLRRDGSSNLGPDNRWGTFPSASIAWRISEENFLKDLKWLDSFKLRAGYGSLGNDNIGNYKYATTLTTSYIGYLFGPQTMGSRDGFIPGVQIATTGNSALKWETTTQINGGIDFILLRDKISGSFDIYKRETKDILVGLPVSSISGLSSNPIVNGGGMKNTGIEIGITTKNNIGSLNYEISANFSTIKNVVTSLGYGKQPIYSNAMDKRALFSRTQVGDPIASFWGFKTAGIFQTNNEVLEHVGPSGDLIQPNAVPGDIRFVDLNDDGILDDNDKTYLGSPTPRYEYGLNINLFWKKFDFSAFLSGAAGFQLINFTTSELNFHNYANVAKSVYDRRWKGEGTSNSVPRLTWNDTNNNLANNSDRYVENGDYLRLRNIQFGYSFESLKKLQIEKLRLYVSTQNLFTFTKFSGSDPELGVSQGGGELDLGMVHSAYPRPTTYMLGINIVF